MKRRDVAAFLRSIDRSFRIVRYSNRGRHLQHGGNDAVCLGTRYVCAIPIGPMYRSGHEEYRGPKYRNRSLRGLVSQLRANSPVLSHKITAAERRLR